MLPSDATAALDSLLDRSLGADVPAVPFPPRPSELPPRPPRRLGVVAAGTVVGALVLAVLVTGRFGGEPGSEPASPPRAVATTAAPPAPEPVARSTVDGIDVEVREPAELDAAYRAVAPDDGVAAVGPARCAQGAAEERAWSRPELPDRAAGRYRCAVVDSHASMWWTVDDRGLLGHAVAADGDLAALFAWWLAHGEAPELPDR